MTINALGAANFIRDLRAIRGLFSEFTRLAWLLLSSLFRVVRVFRGLLAATNLSLKKPGFGEQGKSVAGIANMAVAGGMNA